MMTSIYSNILTDRCGFKFQQYVNGLKKTNYSQFYYHFPDLPFPMQYGLYLEFFDSVGIRIEVFSEAEYPDIYFDYRIWEIKEGCFWSRATIGEYKTRQEAQIGAIKKANEIYNEKS